MSYDSQGNRVLLRELIDADRWQETAYTYDRYGHLCAIRDANGNTMRMTYRESRPGMRSLTTPEGYTSYYTYDDTGCCMSMSDDLGKTEYTYNQMDYRVYVKDPLGNTTKYCFDRLCNLVKLYSSKPVKRENRLVQITALEGIVTKRYAYELHGNITKEINAAGVPISRNG